jgi:DNA-binding MarR family transcriptional regulator
MYLCAANQSGMELEKEIQQTSFRSNRHKAILNILFTAGWLGCRQQRFFKPFDLTPQQYNVLRILRGQKGEAIGVNGIQERMLDRSSNASRLVDKLIEKGLVDRTTSATDRRQVDITITKAGTKMLEQIDAALNSEEEQFGEISEEEAAVLSKLLDKLRN